MNRTHLKKQLGLFLLLTNSIFACRTIKPYEKEFLLHPTMDEGRVGVLSAPYGSSMRPNEKLALSSGSSGSSSCPTCGGK